MGNGDAVYNNITVHEDETSNYKSRQKDCCGFLSNSVYYGINYILAVGFLCGHFCQKKRKPSTAAAGTDTDPIQEVEM